MSADPPGGPWGPFIVAVGTAALATAALVSLAELIRAWGTDATNALDFVFLLALFLSLFVIAPAAALIGLPLTWLLARSRWEAPWTYPAAGLVAGAALMVGLDPFPPNYSWLPVDELALTATLGAVPGFVCGLSWWRNYRRHFRAGHGE